MSIFEILSRQILELTTLGGLLLTGTSLVLLKERRLNSEMKPKKCENLG